MTRTTPSPVALTALWLAMGCGAAPLDAVDIPPENLTEALVAHWTFDEGSGEIASDHSGNGLDAHLTMGATWIADGKFAGGWRLAVGDAASVSGFPAATPNWSISAWIRLSTKQLATDSGTATTILGTENLDTGGWEMSIDYNQPPNPRFVFSYQSATPPMPPVVTECVFAEPNVWIHLAAVVDVEANRVTLYRNGTAVDQKTRSSDIFPGNADLYFGRRNMGGRFMAGDLDDIGIWRRALTAREIAVLTTESP